MHVCHQDLGDVCHQSCHQYHRGHGYQKIQESCDFQFEFYASIQTEVRVGGDENWQVVLDHWVGIHNQLKSEVLLRWKSRYIIQIKVENAKNIYLGTYLCIHVC